MNLTDYLDTLGQQALDPYADRICERVLHIMKLQARNAPRLDVMDARIELFQEVEDWLADDAASTPVEDDDWPQRCADDRFREMEGRNGE